MYCRFQRRQQQQQQPRWKVEGGGAASFAGAGWRWPINFQRPDEIVLSIAGV